jgi:branched-chain amino acid transport system substrate-binding protein
VRKSITLIAAATALLVGACGSTTSSPRPATSTSTSKQSANSQGISGKTITVGTLTDITGPIGGAFSGVIYGARAYAAYVNSQGGVDGYLLSDKSFDSQTTCAGAETAIKAAASSAFALVGGISEGDQCEVPTLKDNPNLPFIQLGLSNQIQALPNYYSIGAGPPGAAVGPYKYLAQRYPAAVQDAAVLYGSTPGTVTMQGYVNAAMKSAGFDLKFLEAIDPTQTDFTADIVRMRNLGIRYVYLNLYVEQNAEFLNQANQQGWHPEVIQPESVIYEADWFKLTNPGANQNVLTILSQAMYLGQDSKSVPEVQTYLTWLKKVDPSYPPDALSAYGWGNMALFTAALRTLGAHPTQAGLLKALSHMGNFDDNGMFAPDGIGSRTAPTCYIIIAPTNNDSWRRVTPASGYRCSPGGYLKAG